jgi:hypothetical protein
MLSTCFRISSLTVRLHFEGQELLRQFFHDSNHTVDEQSADIDIYVIETDFVSRLGLQAHCEVDSFFRGIDSKNRFELFFSSLKEGAAFLPDYFPPVLEATPSIFKALYPREQVAVFFISPEGDSRPGIRMPRYYLFSSLSFLLPHFKRLYIHCSGFHMDGLAGCILGKNKSGKSTSSRLLSRAVLFDDDLNLVEIEKKRALLHSFDFDTLRSMGNPAEIRAIFQISKGKKFEVKRIETQSALSNAWTDHQQMFWNKNSVWHPLSSEGKKLRKQSFNLLADVVTSTPNYRLTFPRDYIDQEQIEAVLRGEHPECHRDV